MASSNTFVGLLFQVGLTSTLVGGTGRDAALVVRHIARQGSVATTADVGDFGAALEVLKVCDRVSELPFKTDKWHSTCIQMVLRGEFRDRSKAIPKRLKSRYPCMARPT